MKLSALPGMLQHLWRRNFVAYPQARPVSLQGKTALVTGCSPGSIGFVTAKTLAQWGAHVVVTSRSTPENIIAALEAELAAEAAPGKIAGHSLDLSKMESVNDFAAWFEDNFSQLDILVNNAGVHFDLLSEWKAPHLVDGFEVHWRINYLGTVSLTEKLLPLMQKTAADQGQARVVTVVSHLHTRGENERFFSGTDQDYNSWQAYGQSKLGLVHYAFELQRRLGEQGVSAFAVHPGSIYTNIANRGLDGHPFLQRMRQRLSFIEKRILLTPQQGAQTQLLCATDPQAEPGCYYQRCAVAEPSTETADKKVGAYLWQQTQAWLQQLGVAVDSKTPQLQGA